MRLTDDGSRALIDELTALLDDYRRADTHDRAIAAALETALTMCRRYAAERDALATKAAVLEEGLRLQRLVTVEQAGQYAALAARVAEAVSELQQ